MFGRLHAPDPRDQTYPLRALLAPRPSTRLFRYWNQSGWYGDQGQTSQCVGYAWAHWCEDGPVTHKGPAPIVAPQRIYRDAQAVDEWEGADYDGTSVRAGAKALMALGFITSYHWATTLDDIVQALLEKGPVVVGTNWYATMMEADTRGYLTVGGEVVGGHAYVLNGVSVKNEGVRLKNSWGQAWSNGGSAWLRFVDVERLLREDGEAAIAVEVANAAPPGPA